MSPRKAYTLGTDVCFSRLLRAGYFESSLSIWDKWFWARSWRDIVAVVSAVLQQSVLSENEFKSLKYYYFNKKKACVLLCLMLDDDDQGYC